MRLLVGTLASENCSLYMCMFLLYLIFSLLETQFSLDLIAHEQFVIYAYTVIKI